MFPSSPFFLCHLFLNNPFRIINVFMACFHRFHLYLSVTFIRSHLALSQILTPTPELHRRSGLEVHSAWKWWSISIICFVFLFLTKSHSQHANTNQHAQVNCAENQLKVRWFQATMLFSALHFQSIRLRDCLYRYDEIHCHLALCSFITVTSLDSQNPAN